MFLITNHDAIRTRGGHLCGDDDFHIVQCANCGCQYLYNDETIQIYLDPNDLTVATLDIKEAQHKPCRKCGEPNFKTEALNENDEQKVREGPWSFLLD